MEELPRFLLAEWSSFLESLSLSFEEGLEETRAEPGN